MDYELAEAVMDFSLAKKKCGAEANMAKCLAPEAAWEKDA
jgi:hypothetical protein